MKPKVVLASLILILSVIFLGALFFLRGEKVQSMVLIRESEGIQIKKPGDSAYTAVIQEETSLPNGTFIKTNDTGIGHVLLPDNSLISLDINTEIQATYENASVDIVQIIGKTWHRVVNITTGSYEVHTPTALATVRGTIFAVEVGEDDEISVLESRVDVQQKEEDGTLGTAQLIEQDSQAIVSKITKRKGLVVQRIPETKRAMSWFLKNRDLDTKIRGQLRDKIREKLRERITLIHKFSLRLRTMGAVEIDMTLNEYACQKLETITVNLDRKAKELEQKRVAAQYSEALIKVKEKLITACGDGIVTGQEVLDIQEILKNTGFSIEINQDVQGERLNSLFFTS